MDDITAGPGFVVPALATDCHMHVFGDPARFPPAAWRAYDPTERNLADYDAVAGQLGFGRVVFVQPSAYGADNRCMLEALRARPGTSRGVAVIDAATAGSELAAMNAAGVRGIRLNLVSNGEPDPAAAALALREAAARVGPLGWHVQIFALPALLAGLAPVIRDLPVPVVIDHMGAGDGRLAESRPGFDDVLRLLEEGRCWVKISGADRVSRQQTGFQDAVTVMRALIAANPARVVWGTDWPHIGPHKPGQPRPVVYLDLDNTGLLHLLGQAADAAQRQAILVDNPAHLYGFQAPAQDQ
jgi:predicted TIM-barrel fold metal-dependent hydrolase